jgi:hypothetical protein
VLWEVGGGNPASYPIVVGTLRDTNRIAMKKPAHTANRLPPLQSLLAFKAAARLGSFSLAAHDLALTQSAISHQIQNLESWLGQPVFRRMGRGVQLTAAGVLHTGRQRIDPYGNPVDLDWLHTGVCVRLAAIPAG